MKKLATLLCFALTLYGCSFEPPPSNHSHQHFDVPTIGPDVKMYKTASEENELEGVQVPVPRDCRILNRKGSCVWCSMELLGRYAEIKSLYGITKNPGDGGDPRCQGAANINHVRSFLQSKGIRYEDVLPYGGSDPGRVKGKALLVKACKTERRGAAFAIPGHMLVCVHYDPDTKTVKVIDNADWGLNIQTWSWEKFHRVWDGWVYVLYGDPDIVPNKYTSLPNQIPIKDRNNKQGKYDKDYIPSPNR